MDLVEVVVTQYCLERCENGDLMIHILDFQEQYMMAHVTVQTLFQMHLDMMEDHTYGNIGFNIEVSNNDFFMKQKLKKMLRV